MGTPPSSPYAQRLNTELGRRGLRASLQHGSHAARQHERAAERPALREYIEPSWRARRSDRAGAPDWPRGDQNRRVPVLQRRSVGDHLPALHRGRAGNLDSPYRAARCQHAATRSSASCGRRTRLDRRPRAPVGQLGLHLARAPSRAARWVSCACCARARPRSSSRLGSSGCSTT
eukprot:3278130-Prymnesium_polylepis.1